LDFQVLDEGVIPTLGTTITSPKIQRYPSRIGDSRVDEYCWFSVVLALCPETVIGYG